MTANTYGWGIIGVGAIAANFAQGLHTLQQAKLVGVAARSQAKADSHAASFGATKGFEGAEALITDPAVDIVYIASLGGMHREHATAALEAGKAVLIEKPIATHAEDAAAIAAKATETGGFCMEAMWMRFQPLVQQLKATAKAGRLGRPIHFAAEAAYRTADERLADGDAARGAILNFGCYGVSLAHHLFGVPTDISSSVHRQGELDRSFTALLRYDGFDATISGSVDGTLANRAVATFLDGRIELDAPFFDPPSLDEVAIGKPSGTASPAGKAGRLLGKIPGAKAAKSSRLAGILRGQRKTTPAPAGSNGLALEAAEVMRCLDEGLKESPVMTLAQSVEVMQTLDAIGASTPR
ncbi:MAG: Gfo/Idh/MocA family oxidoreductase [Parvularculaceae bacterium]|nr:Gfo/Idh/MocA family oxidoreductase [Parvularculaceae bacterium]